MTELYILRRLSIYYFFNRIATICNDAYRLIEISPELSANKHLIFIEASLLSPMHTISISRFKILEVYDELLIPIIGFKRAEII